MATEKYGWAHRGPKAFGERIPKELAGRLLFPNERPRRRADLWSIEELTLLRILYEKGLSLKQIAAKIGRSIKAVERQTSNLGLERPRKGAWTNDKLKLLISLRKKGKTYMEIAKVLDKSYDAVKLKARYIGITDKT